jgi:FAD/FMN-containing dehydrogenase
MTTTDFAADLHAAVPTAELLAPDAAADPGIDGLRPRAIVRPASAADVAAVLAFAAGAGLAVTCSTSGG